ncbi:DUF4198 domain-containing protein [Gemmatimonas sp.]|uniref:DUF4198 domain-containing protein n=1 Tax=Gemmatimonas sp. TaxID=1962908 RepID=UPI0039835244
MHRRLAALPILLALSATSLFAHDMFWRLTSYYVAPRSSIRMPVLNGTFSKSENSIAWSRVAQLSVATPTGRTQIDSAHWDTRGDTSWLNYVTGEAGTYVAGLSTKPTEFRLEAKAFNRYLADDGIPDILAARTKDGSLQRAARERYSKHIKTIFQVGATRSDGWSAALGHPAELVPVENPYGLAPGATMRFRCLVDGNPVANQLVIVGGRAGVTGDVRLPTQSLRSNADGVVSVTVGKAGRWYVKFIHMARVDDGRVDYESKWATITFEIR